MGTQRWWGRSGKRGCEGGEVGDMGMWMRAHRHRVCRDTGTQRWGERSGQLGTWRHEGEEVGEMGTQRWGER